MVAPRSESWIARTALYVVALAVVGVLACSSSPTPTASRPSEGPAEGADRLTDVRVESSGGGSIITLQGLRDPVYTAFMHAEPRALVLDIASVEIATPNDLVMVYDGLVENVTVSTYGGSAGESLTRVEIALSQDASYEISGSGEGLQAVLTPADSMASMDAGEEQSVADEAAWATELGTSEATPEEVASDETMLDEGSDSGEVDPWADPGAETIGAEDDSLAMEPSEDEIFEPVAEPIPTTPATALTGVSYLETMSGVLVHLEADGSVGAMETFTLEDPARLVIDMPGLGSTAPGKTAVGTAQVAQVRVGAHPDKVRVVIDGGAGAGNFEERRISPAANGLYLALGSGEDLETALDDALGSSETMAAAGSGSGLEMAAEEGAVAESAWDDTEVASAETAEITAADTAVAASSASAQVYGIHYDSKAEYERVVILSDTLVDYDLLQPDDETLVISIPDARVAPEATGRVTAHPRKPISLISTFQQPDVEVPEVRVVVKRASGLQPSVLRRGSMIFVDFANNGLVAAPPPAFQTEQEWIDAGLAGETPAAPTSNTMVADGGGEVLSIDTQSPALVDDQGETVESPEMEFAETDPAMGDLEALPSFEESTVGMDIPAAAGSPAALESPAAAEILEEGGLIDGKEYQGRRISLDFKDVPVADVLRLIAEVSDLNLIAGDEVEGNVTIRLVDVPWDQALDVILLTKGLGFVRVGSVLRIAPADIIKAEEELRLQERRNKETLEDLVVKLQPVNYASVADMAQLVKRLLTPRGTVNTDVRTNTLIIKDIPSVIDEATALIKAIDTETPQVLIEAKIVEAALDFSRELGSVWSMGTNELEDGFSGNAPRRDLGGPDFRFHDSNNVIFGNPITSVPTGLLNMNAFVLNEDFNVNVQIQAAESTGDGKVISSPRVLTLDNREAEIQQGVSIPFQTFENGDAKLEFIDAVLSLLVTPHVTSDKTIIMQVEVTRNAPDDSVPTPTGSPAIARAEARTETLVKDGQTLVIGGIYTVNESERESRVPYLHRIPVIGSAFKSREVTDQRKELLIFVTPRIVLASELAGN
jgi:type IV pilus assembly protein PilQ